MLRYTAESLKAGIIYRRKIVGGILILLLLGVLLLVTLFAVLSGHLYERERERSYKYVYPNYRSYYALLRPSARFPYRFFEVVDYR